MSKRYRVMHKFWLDITKEDEDQLDEQIHWLKANRSFVKVVKDGIRLICDLRKGRVDVLFELFPWVKAEFLAGIQTQETAGEKALRQQLERLEKLLIEQGNTPIPMPQLPASTGPKALDASRFDLPTFDDEDDLETILLQPDTSTDSAANFLNSVLNLQK